VPRSHIFLLPLQMSTILYLLILDIPTYDLFSRSLALKGKQPLKEVLSLTILVSIVLAIPIAPLYMYMRDLWEVRVFIKSCRIATLYERHERAWRKDFV
jgi:hypothetical protein